MVSKNSRILSEEHKNILKVIALLEIEHENLAKGKLRADFILKAIDFIKNYADKLHHAKEEDIFFKEFEAKVAHSSTHCNPVPQMLFEHDNGRTFVKEIIAGVQSKDIEKISENIANYCNLLKEHISKEDDILYPMIDEVLDTKKQSEILKKFEKIDSDRKKEIKNYESFAKTAK